MGTRGLYGFIIDEKIYAQYHHYDSVLNQFLASKQLETFKQKLLALEV